MRLRQNRASGPATSSLSIFLARYLFTLSGRWDGSSMLADGKEWYFFPTAAFAWRISDEAFMKSTESWLPSD